MPNNFIKYQVKNQNPPGGLNNTKLSLGLEAFSSKIYEFDKRI